MNSESARVEKHLNQFHQKLVMDVLDRTKKTPDMIAKIFYAGGEGPTIGIEINGTPFYFQCYMGVSTDYRPKYVALAREILIEHGFAVEVSIS